ncbi:sensor histidine kinase [Pontibacter mangrovi]|uniref:Sensor histidine kinase n=1 Tax=Pontibacter mangrovi TaxID=2589816 RepID=A0A501W6N7_9BACT|nr:sensor histidine kinase [Pontibacter mangrovi]TPE44392.1 sensor histidine kinase [Pontibacter mangrovi]
MKTLEPLILITPIMLLLAVGIIVFVVLYQRRMLQHQEHLRQLQATKQQQLLQATFHAQEEERRRVARDLHDEVGAMLALIRLNLYQMMNSTACDDEGLHTSVQNMKQQLDDVLVSVRRISHDLMPVVLEKMGLGQAIEALRRNLTATGQLEMELRCNDKNKRLLPQHELVLYRMVQELLNNTLKHAKATKVTIDLHFGEKDIELLYKDNGVGFKLEKIVQEQQEKEGLGIMSLQSRAALLDGDIQITSAPGAGTAVAIKVPVATQPNLHTTNYTNPVTAHGVSATNIGNSR